MLLRLGLRKTTLKLTALTTAVALALAPTAALAQQNKGPPVLRDTESEQLLRDYTRPILRAAGMEKQNIQMVIINESVVQRFRRRRPPHLRQLRRDDAVGNAEPDHRRAGA